MGTVASAHSRTDYDRPLLFTLCTTATVATVCLSVSAYVEMSEDKLCFLTVRRHVENFKYDSVKLLALFWEGIVSVCVCLPHDRRSPMCNPPPITKTTFTGMWTAKAT